jgi:hypothetical protein
LGFEWLPPSSPVRAVGLECVKRKKIVQSTETHEDFSKFLRIFLVMGFLSFSPETHETHETGLFVGEWAKSKKIERCTNRNSLEKQINL